MCLACVITHAIQEHSLDYRLQSKHCAILNKSKQTTVRSSRGHRASEQKVMTAAQCGGHAVLCATSEHLHVY